MLALPWSSLVFPSNTCSRTPFSNCAMMDWSRSVSKYMKSRYMVAPFGCTRPNFHRLYHIANRTAQAFSAGAERPVHQPPLKARSIGKLQKFHRILCAEGGRLDARVG